MKSKQPMKSVMLCFFSIVSLSVVGADFPATSSSPKSPKIATIIFQDDQFFRLIEFGAREGAQRAGASTVEGNSDNKLDKERQLVDAFIISKADAILISPLSRKA